jgi:phosphonate transport system permease protein
MTVHRLRHHEADWRFPSSFGWRTVLASVLVAAMLVWSGLRVDVPRVLALSERAGPAGAPAAGVGAIVAQMVPPQLAERTDIARIPGFDPAHLPPLAYLETERVVETALDPSSLALQDRTVTRTWLVAPFGYAATVAGKMVETFEIALWGTLVALAIGLVLGMAAARTIVPHALPRGVARLLLGVLRSVPELVLALVLVLAYGFGPVAGFLALGLHGGGVLGRFFAEQIEHADPRPQQALQAIGAGRLAIWRIAILPEVAPHHVGSILYILDRNVRMATVVGLVGAGGIGQELKGRFDLYDYAHVGTILIAILIVVLLLDQVSARLRHRLL